VAILTDGRTAVSAGWDGALRWADVPSGTRGREVSCGASGRWAATWASLAAGPSGWLAAAGACGADRVVVFDAVSGERRRVLLSADETPSSTIALASSGDLLIAGCAQGLLRSWRMPQGDAIADRVLAGSDAHAIWCLRTSPDGSKVALGLSGGNVALVATPGLETLVRTTAPPRATACVNAIAWSPDGRSLVTAGLDGTLQVLDPTTLAPRGEAVALHVPVHDLGFSPDGARLVAALGDGTLSVLEWPSLEELARLHGHERYVHAIAWLPDGTGFVSASGDGTVRSWTTLALRDHLAARRARG
jgi:WD40 repeat protein